MKFLTKHAGKIFILASITLILIAWRYTQTQAEINNQGVIQTQNIKGNLEANITLVKFGDFECPFCAQAATQVDDVLEKYGNQIKFEYRPPTIISNSP